MTKIIKNRNREHYTFANINLLGKCNVNCFFCLGKDIETELSCHNQISVHFSKWKNFERFLEVCKIEGINKLYLTGQNTDPLLYRYLDEIIDYLQEEKGFSVGLRTNGYLAMQKKESIKKLKDEIGYSINSLDPMTNYKIMKRIDIPDWENILAIKENTRVSIVINKYNETEFEKIVEYLSKFPNVRYVQARRISTDTRYEPLKEHIECYESLFSKIRESYKQIGTFYKAELFNIFNKEVVFWRTVETSVNSLNYFTDGTLSQEYFVVEGYLKNKFNPVEESA